MEQPIRSDVHEVTVCMYVMVLEHGQLLYTTIGSEWAPSWPCTKISPS